jgi:hypothetical protein
MNATVANLHARDTVRASRHAILRFAVGVTVAFVLCEWLQWTPTFLAPVLTAVLITNLPARPPLKMALGLVVIMTVVALVPFVMTSLLRGMPFVLFGLITLCMFLAFHSMLSGRPRVPALLLLICLAIIPVVVMVAPAMAGGLPLALVRGIALALVLIAVMHALWPLLPQRRPAQEPDAQPEAAPRKANVLPLALLSTAVMLPVLLVYLLFGLADALPVIVTTVMLVVNFDPQRSQKHALALILGNFAGGMLGWLMHTVLLTTPNLLFLALLLFVVLLGFGQEILRGGSTGMVALVGCNAMLIIFGSAIASGPGSLSIWLVRLFQFALAGAFAVGMMSLLWHRAGIPRSIPPAAAR